MPPGGWRAGRKKRVDQLWHHSTTARLPALESEAGRREKEERVTDKRLKSDQVFCHCVVTLVMPVTPSRN